MLDKNKFVFLESNTTGTGELLLHKALAKNMSPIFITKNPNKYTFLPLKYVNLITLDTSNREILLEYLLKINKLIGIYSSSEYYIETTSWLADQLGLPGTNTQAINKCRDKYSLHQILMSSEIGSPQTQRVIDVNEVEEMFNSTSFPLIVKPETGTGSMGVKLCKDKDDCITHVRLLQKSCLNVLIQEYIEAPEFSVEVCSIANKHHIIGITQKYLGHPPYFIETGHDFPAILLEEDEQQIKKMVKKLLSLLSFDFGFTHIELKIKNGKIFIIEVNPRLAGGMIPVLIKKATDVDLLDILLELYTNHHVDFQISYKKFSSIRHLIPSKAGKIKYINFRKPSFVTEIRLFKNKEDIFIPQCDFRDRIAYVIVSDPDAEYCKEKANQALKNFDLEIEGED